MATLPGTAIGVHSDLAADGYFEAEGLHRRAYVVAQRDPVGIEFPVAVDADWTLRSWWLDGRERVFTSVTFVLDREGVVRQVHRGGEIARGSSDPTSLRKAIEACL